jgi:tetratricopeptide (TPR) repeat protein
MGYVSVAPARADGPAERRVTGFALPTRRTDHDELTRRAARVAALVAHRIGAQFSQPGALGGADVDVDELLTRARALERSGQLEEAIATYDAALETGARAPFAIGRATAWIEAAVARASLALARGEQERARDLLVHLVRMDPGFDLSASEARPSMRDELARVRTELGARPDVDRRTLGRACQANIDVLIVARPLPSGGTEFLRFDRCRLRSRAELGGGSDSEAVAALLVGEQQTARKAAPATRSARPLYRRAWFWIGVAAVGSAATAAGVLVFRDKEIGYDVGLRW